MQIKRMVTEQRFNVQTRHLTRLVRSAYRLCNILEKEISMQLDVDEQGLHVYVASHQGSLKGLIVPAKDYKAIKSLYANGEEVIGCEFVFSPKSPVQVESEVEFGPALSNKRKKRKTLTSKSFFIQNIKKILTT